MQTTSSISSMATLRYRQSKRKWNHIQRKSLASWRSPTLPSQDVPISTAAAPPNKISFSLLLRLPPIMRVMHFPMPVLTLRRLLVTRLGLVPTPLRDMALLRPVSRLSVAMPFPLSTTIVLVPNPARSRTSILTSKFLFFVLRLRFRLISLSGLERSICVVHSGMPQ